MDIQLPREISVSSKLSPLGVSALVQARMMKKNFLETLDCWEAVQRSPWSNSVGVSWVWSGGKGDLLNGQALFHPLHV